MNHDAKALMTEEFLVELAETLARSQLLVEDVKARRAHAEFAQLVRSAMTRLEAGTLPHIVLQSILEALDELRQLPDL